MNALRRVAVWMSLWMLSMVAAICLACSPPDAPARPQGGTGH